jgi:hypothetical protein
MECRARPFQLYRRDPIGFALPVRSFFNQVREVESFWLRGQPSKQGAGTRQQWNPAQRLRVSGCHTVDADGLESRRVTKKEAT